MTVFWFLLILLGLWLVAEIGMRLVVELPLRTDFYSSIQRDQVRARQEKFGVQAAHGLGWAHLGWIADPNGERYHILQQQAGGQWQEIGQAEFGSFLLDGAGGQYQVWAEALQGGERRLVGQAVLPESKGAAQVYRPSITGEWMPVFKPDQTGRYLNDHTIFQDQAGNWRLVGITS